MVARPGWRASLPDELGEPVLTGVGGRASGRSRLCNDLFAEQLWSSNKKPRTMPGLFVRERRRKA